MPKEPEGNKTGTTPKAGAPDGSGTPPKGGEGDPPPYEFKDPTLKGKSPQEIEALFAMSKQIVESQGTKLTRVTGELADARRKPTGDPPPKGDGTKKSFFDDPDAALERMAASVEAQIAPLRREIQEAREGFAATTIHDTMRSRHGDWDSVYPYVQNIIATQDPPFPNPNEPGLLNSLYYMAKAMMFEKGVITSWDGKKAEGDETGDPPPKGGPPPQHRSSPPPPPPKGAGDGGKEVTWDDLDETEKAMAKFYKMSPSEFREFGAVNAEEVITSKIGQPKEGA